MGKILLLEFEEDTPLEEIKSEMEYYQSADQIVLTIINGEEIYSNDEKFDDIFRRISLGLTEEEYEKRIAIEQENSLLEERLNRANSIEELPHIRFYLGLAKSMIIPEKINEFESRIIGSWPLYKKSLILATQIMLAFSQQDELKRFESLSQIMGKIGFQSPEDEVDSIVNLKPALNLIKEYSIYQDMVDAILFKGTTDNYQERIKSRIKSNQEKANTLQKNPNNML